MLTVRGAEPDDASAVAVVHVRSWQVGYRGLLPDDYLDGLRPEQRSSRYTFGLDDPEAPSTLLAVEGDEIRGFVTTGPARDLDVVGCAEILALYVDPPCWGAGVGQRLMVEARAALEAGGLTEGVLWVLAGNERASRFYQADGWRLDGETRSEVVWGVEVNEVRRRIRF